MGSLVVKIDAPTQQKLNNIHHYSDIDMLDNFVRKDGNDEVPMVYDVEAVKMSIRNILMWRVGESILHPSFGHNLKKSMYAQLDQFNEDKIGQEIQRAIEENEPRVDVRTVAVKNDDEDDENNTLKVKVVYRVKGDKTGNSELVEQSTISTK